MSNVMDVCGFRRLTDVEYLQNALDQADGWMLHGDIFHSPFPEPMDEYVEIMSRAHMDALAMQLNVATPQTLIKRKAWIPKRFRSNLGWR